MPRSTGHSGIQAGRVQTIAAEQLRTRHPRRAIERRYTSVRFEPGAVILARVLNSANSLVLLCRRFLVRDLILPLRVERRMRRSLLSGSLLQLEITECFGERERLR